MRKKNQDKGPKEVIIMRFVPNAISNLLACLEWAYKKYMQLFFLIDEKTPDILLLWSETFFYYLIHFVCFSPFGEEHVSIENPVYSR